MDIGRGYLSYSGHPQAVPFTNICDNLHLFDTAIPRDD